MRNRTRRNFVKSIGALGLGAAVASPFSGSAVTDNNIKERCDPEYHNDQLFKKAFSHHAVPQQHAIIPDAPATLLTQESGVDYSF